MVGFWTLNIYLLCKNGDKLQHKALEFHEYKFVKLAHVSFGAASSVCLLRRVINEIPRHE
jgi:hypothetical protein